MPECEDDCSGFVWTGDVVARCICELAEPIDDSVAVAIADGCCLFD
nr:hypothetical protein [Corynebacterium striatum]